MPLPKIATLLNRHFDGIFTPPLTPVLRDPPNIRFHWAQSKFQNKAAREKSPVANISDLRPDPRNFTQLRIHPHFGPVIRKLEDFTPDTWRYRIGAWRFFYEIDEKEKITFMVAASHRSSAY